MPMPTRRIITTRSSTPHTLLVTLFRSTRWAAALVGGFILVAVWIGPNLLAFPWQVQRASQPSTQVALDIMPVRPGGPAEGYAAYLPSTALRVPAHSTITVTIRNFDLEPAVMSAALPYTTVQGTVGGVAYADGRIYTALDRTAVAHTFTVPQLGLNVPIPDRAASGRPDVVVTFRFRTSSPGTFAWQCFDPCGNGPDGMDGPMTELDYMRGSLTDES